MRATFFPRSPLSIVFVSIAILLMVRSDAVAGGKCGLYGIRMVPRGADAEDYSRPGWGGGVHAVVPVPQLSNMVAGVVGLEVINLMSETVEFADRVTGLRVEQQTNQNYWRVYLGSQVGGHGDGFFRPHAGLNVAMAFYDISTDVVVPDDYDRENEIRQKLRSEQNTVFGYDVTLGIDLNFSNTVAVDGGVRYVKSFSLPQQLGEGSEKIHPQYFQTYIGAGISFEKFKKTRSEEEK